MKLGAALSVVLLCALAAAGAASAAPTKPEFIRKGDALCADVARQLRPIRRRAEAAKSLPEAQKWAAAAELWTDQISIQRRFNMRMRAIGTPRGDTRAARLVAALGGGVVLARRVRDGFARRDRDALARALTAYVRFTIDLNARVRAYGFRVCGKS
jgi:hypothetical protein